MANNFKNFMPPFKKILPMPLCVYLHTNPIRSMISIFHKFLSNLDFKVILQKNSILSYNCVDSGFIDHQHAVTGDWRNLENNKLTKLFTKGSKYK